MRFYQGRPSDFGSQGNADTFKCRHTRSRDQAPCGGLTRTASEVTVWQLLCIYVASFLFSTAQAHALDPNRLISQYGHTVWRSNEGAAPAPVAITQTTDGYIGMPPPPDIKEPDIKEIVGDARGRLWVIITGSGEYTVRDGKWEEVPVLTGKDHDIAPDTEFVDALGRAWLVYYARNTVVMIDGAKRTLFTPGHGLDLGNPIVGWASGTQVWVSGTGGLGFFDRGRFQNIRASDGSRFEGATAIIPTEHDGLRLKAPKGVVQIPPDEISAFLRDHNNAVNYRTFDVASDFAAPLARRRVGTDALRSGDGKLWFSVLGGVAMIDPAHLAKNDLPPPVFLRSLTANGRAYSTYHDLTLPKSTRDVSLDYTALSLTLSERNRFRYQLVGQDKDWQEAGTRRQAYYTNLSPRTYTFKVIAANNDGVWNETGASVTFTILPTFFQTTWFEMLSIVVAGCMLWALYALRLRQATSEVSARLGERLRERERIARELHDTLLQDFQAVILRFQLVANRLAKADPNRVAMESGLDYADKVLIEGRYQIRSIRADAQEKDELSKSLAAYGEELTQLWPRLFHLTVIGKQFEIHPALRDEIYRIGREALGNAFKHSNGSAVEMEIAYLAAEFRMRISDDGDGIDPGVADRGRAGHWGIDNMRERARKIGAVLKILSRPNNGTSVELKIPLELARERHGFGLLGVLRTTCET
jgi:signal transduction histidine kinase